MKKIVFICGSMEPARDGVGDYTRRLASELIEQGNEVKIIALADKYIQSEWMGIQRFENVGINVLRLPFSALWDYRLKLAKRFVDGFNPEWISLQFVLFSFDKRGLPIFLARKMQKINTHAKWHIMFHELWVGMNNEASLKLKLTGLVQKQIIRSFVKALTPKLIHTHTGVYKTQLEELHKNLVIRYLPLFTNIPNNIMSISKEGKNVIFGGSDIIFSVFGSIYNSVPIDVFADELLMAIRKKNLKPKIKILGHFNQQQNYWLHVFEERGISAKLLGDLTSEQVSEELSCSNYGLSTTPKLLAGKSGSIAAMLAHSLPVICITKPWSIKGNSNKSHTPDNIFEYEPGNLSLILNSSVGKNIAPTLQDVAHHFIQDLSNNDK